MSARDRHKNKMVQDAIGCHERHAAGIIEYMDRNYRNPEWSAIDMPTLQEHLKDVLSAMSTDSIASSELRTMFRSTDDDPFYRPYKQHIKEEDMQASSQRHGGETRDSVREMTDAEFEKWAESLPDVNEMSNQEFAEWVEMVRTRPDLDAK